jgi:hypothetical protein
MSLNILRLADVGARFASGMDASATKLLTSDLHPN